MLVRNMQSPDWVDITNIESPLSLCQAYGCGHTASASDTERTRINEIDSKTERLEHLRNELEVHLDKADLNLTVT